MDATMVNLEGEQIRFVLKEEVRGRKRELNASEKRDHERLPSVYAKDFAWTYDSTNRFTFGISYH